MKQPFSPDFGKQLSQTLQDALNSGDFSKLKNTIDDTVKEVRHSFNSSQFYPAEKKNPSSNQAAGTSKGPVKPPPRASYPPSPSYPKRPPVQGNPPPYPRTGAPGQNGAPVYGPRQGTAQGRYMPRQNVPANPQRVYNPSAIYARPNKQKVPGSVAGVLFTVFGAIGASLSTLGWLLPCAISDSLLLPLSIVMLPIIASFFVMIGAGTTIRRRVARYRRYRQIIGTSRYYSIEQLAGATAQSRSALLRDLKKMIRRGMFTNTYLDEKGTCLMMDHETYQQYLNAKMGMENRQMKESRLQPAQKKEPAEKGIFAEGQEYLEKIKVANLSIADVELSQKLDRLEAVTSKIFSYVGQHPDKVSDIRRFMSYYLPTTLKLVNAYQEFDSQKVEGDNIGTTKAEIREILDKINTAFENLLDDLFEDAAMDISTDISALEVMLAQDGLTDDEFTMGQNKE